MGIFGKKEKGKENIQEIKQAIEDISLPTELPTIQGGTTQKETPLKELPALPKQEIREEKPSFAPLFVKIDKYRQILSSLNYVKTSVATLHNSFEILNELDKLKTESLNMIKDSLNKIDKRLQTLDSEFLRPSGFHEDVGELQEVEGLSSTIEDLKGQIEQLKGELQNIA